MNPRHVGNGGPPANIDINPVGLQDFIVDHDGVRRLKACMALNDRTICRSPEPLLHSLVRPRRDCILSGFDSPHIDAHITNGETIFRTSAGNMYRVGTRHERLCGDAPRVHACAAKFVAFDNRDGFAGTCKPRCQGRARLARPDNDCVEVLHCRGQCAPSMWLVPSLTASLQTGNGGVVSEFPRFEIMCPSVRPIEPAMREARMNPQSTAFPAQPCRP